MNMTPQEKQLARVIFKLKIHEADGFAYENLFAKIMNYARADFRKIRPYGNQGDRGNDAYEPQAGRYYQVFAPEDPGSKTQEAITKVEKDFATKLLPYWNSVAPVREYFFVFNDKYRGTTYPLENTLAAIRVTHNLNRAQVFLAPHLEDVFMGLDEDKIFMIVGGVPTPESLPNLDYGIIAEVIDYVRTQHVNHALTSNLTAPDFDKKIQFNGLKQTACYLQSKQFETYQIDEYLSRNSDFAKANLRDHLATLYSESLNCYPESSPFPQDDFGDLRFVTIMEKIAPLRGNPDYDRLRRDVALILMAKYFETCDIFEEPPHAAT